MRRITLWLLSTISVLVLLLSYRTSTIGAGGPSTQAAAPAGDPAGGGAGIDPATGSGAVDGSVAQTRWGPVQVRISVSGNRITDVTPLRVPDSNFRDKQINDYALPILRQQALAAQSAQIDGVSGATVTSDGYRESLQSAISAAHL
jgi:uncharacterized protein with FMN-binding domain